MVVPGILDMVLVGSRDGKVVKILKMGLILIKMALFGRIDDFNGRRWGLVTWGDQKWSKCKFGSKSLKSDNLTFFRILRIIEKNEGGTFT